MCRIGIVLFIMVSTFFSIAQENVLKNTIPASNSFTGWVFDNETAPDKNGYVDNETKLKEMFDGFIFPHLENGFTEGIFQLYKKGEDNLKIDLFNQGSKANAMKLFAAMIPRANETVKIGADTMVIDNEFLTDAQASMVINKFFIQVTYRRTDENRETAIAMARHMLNKVPIINSGMHGTTGSNGLGLTVRPSRDCCIFSIQGNKQLTKISGTASIMIYNGNGKLLHSIPLGADASRDFIWSPGKTTAFAAGNYSAILTTPAGIATVNFTLY